MAHWNDAESKPTKTQARISPGSCCQAVAEPEEKKPGRTTFFLLTRALPMNLRLSGAGWNEQKALLLGEFA
jgi:hypothetical protein